MSKLALIQYYVNNQKIVLDLGIEPVTPTLESQSLALYLNSKYKLHNLKYFTARPDLVKFLLHLVMNRDDRIADMEKKILHPDFFLEQKIDNISRFFDFLDPAMETRIQKSMEESSDCFICYETRDQKDHLIFQCGHGMCSGCRGNLKSGNCPFCRQKITSSQTRLQFVEYKKKQKEADSKDEKEDAEILTQCVWKFIPDGNDYVVRRMKSLLGNNGTFSESNANELRALMDYDLTLFRSVFTEAKGVGSEEVRSLVAGELYSRLVKPTQQLKKDPSQYFDELTILLNTPNRLLRFLCYIKGKSFDIDGKIEAKFCGATRRWLMSVVANFPNDATTYEQFKTHQPIWKFFFKMIHAGEYKKLAQAQHFVKFVRDGTEMPFKTPNSEFDSLMAKKSDGIFAFLLTHPGLFYRNARSILRTFYQHTQLPFFLTRMVPLLRPSQQMELLYVLDPKKLHSNVFINRKGGIHWNGDKKDAKETKVPKTYMHALLKGKGDLKKEKKDDKEAKTYTQVHENKLYEHISKIILHGVKTKYDDYACVIDDRDNQLSHTLLKRGRPQKPVDWLGKEPSKRGCSLQLPHDQEILAFIYWKNAIDGSRVDLDLSVQGYDEKFGPMGECSFRCGANSFSGTMTFSGDIVDAPFGASEYIRFTLSDFKEKNPQIRYLTINTMSYTGLSFEKMRESLVGIGIVDAKMKGDGPNDSKVIDACRLEGGAKHNIGAYIDLSTDVLTYVNLSPSVKKQKGGRHHLGNSNKLISDLLKSFITWKQTVSAPSDYLRVSQVFASNCSKVVVLNKKGRTGFLKRKGENSLAFMGRVQEGKDIDKVVECDKDVTLYFGCPSYVLAKGSVIVSSRCVTNQDLNKVVVYDEPYKLLSA